MADARNENPLQKPMKRRDFVKTTVKVAAGGAIVASVAPLAVSINPIQAPLNRFPYVGARILPPGPAPQGIPLIPVTVNADGVLEGIPENTQSRVKHSLEWYKYCSHEQAPGLELGFTKDNRFRYFALQEKFAAAEAQGFNLWYKDLLDQEVRASHFKNIGDGAPIRWRSEGQVQNNIITGIVVKIDPSKVKGAPEGFVHDNGDGTGFIAVVSFCAHFCCVPGYLENNSPLAKVPGAGVDGHVLYCSCHDSRYDFMDIRPYTFPPDF
jgi:nitrite reductase/ring-hydroxylating ferredoxin subunit